MANRLSDDAFAFYVSLGAERSYSKVAAQYGVSKRSVARHATDHDWAARLRAVESKARAKTDDALAESLSEMNERHLKLLRVVQGKAIETLRSMPIERAMDAVRALDLMMKQERLIREGDDDEGEDSVESIIRREYQEWLLRPGEEGADDDEDAGDSDAGDSGAGNSGVEIVDEADEQSP